MGGRKGHHEPLANWARDQGFNTLRINGLIVPIDAFNKLDRYKEHDIDLVVAELANCRFCAKQLSASLATALKFGKGNAFIMDELGVTLTWLSTERTDPSTGEAFPELDPKNFLGIAPVVGARPVEASVKFLNGCL